MTPSPSPPKSRTKGCVAFLAFALLALAAGAYFYYARVLFPEPKAERHVPLGAHFLARCDFVELATSKPVRERILPVLLEHRLDTKGANDTLRDDLADKTGIRLPDDARELVAASVDGRRWVVALGGAFARGRFVGGLEALLRERGYSGWSRDGELLVHSLGLAVGQADDGTLLFATHRDIALAALPARDSDDDDALPALPLPAKGALAFAIDDAAWSGLVTALPIGLPVLGTLAKVARVEGAFHLAAAPSVELSLWPKPGGSAATLAGELDTALGVLKLASLVAPDDALGAREALRDARVTSEDSVVRVVAPWSEAALDRVALAAADLLAVVFSRN